MVKKGQLRVMSRSKGFDVLPLNTRTLNTFKIPYYVLVFSS